MNDNQSNPYTEHYLVDFHLAQQMVIAHCNLHETELVDSLNALGRVVAEDLDAPASLPPFNNSAMDGYAVNASDTDKASPESPVELKLVGVIAAGESGQDDLADTQGLAYKIMTGAPVPKCFDSIIPVENTQLQDERVFCLSPTVLGAHIRNAGEDFVLGEKIISCGKIVDANTIMALAALGIGQIKVFKRIDIAVFSTGKELVDDPNQALAKGQIRNSNKPFILSWLQHLPVRAFDAGTNYDQVEVFEDALQGQLDQGPPIIISSGAVSMGDFDFIPQTIVKLGGKIIFHKSKIKPGKPILFAKFPNGSLYFGLPGNPISADIGLRFFVSTAIRAMLDLSAEKPLKAKLNAGFNKKAGFAAILKANASQNANAELVVDILPGQESFKIKPLLRAKGWAFIDQRSEQSMANELIDYYPNQLIWE